jgi:hypothetical protein
MKSRERRMALESAIGTGLALTGLVLASTEGAVAVVGQVLVVLGLLLVGHSVALALRVRAERPVARANGPGRDTRRGARGKR